MFIIMPNSRTATISDLISVLDDDDETTSEFTQTSVVEFNRNNNNDNNLQVGSKSHHHHHSCHTHEHKCFCLKKLYDGDEICRRQKHATDELEFGFVSNVNGTLKALWTHGTEIREESVRSLELDEIRLIDRITSPGDLIYVNKKQGEVQEVSWTAIVRLPESNDSVLLDIPCERLVPLVPYYAGQRVFEENGWIGTITHVYTEATLMFNKGRTATIDCTFLPPDDRPYPGRKVYYTLAQYKRAGLEKLGGRKLKELYDKDDLVEAFVLFLNVRSVHVTWNGRVAVSFGSGPRNNNDDHNESKTTPPPTNLTRNYLKRHVKVFGTSKDINWDAHPDANDLYYTCSVKPTDEVLADADVDNYLGAKYFGNREMAHSFVGSVGGGNCSGKVNNIMTNVDHVCRVLRLSRVIKVKWLGSGKVDKIRANIITLKHSFNLPFHQIVQRKLLLAPYTYDEYGVTLTRDLNDTLSVKWLSCPRDVSTASSSGTTDEHYVAPAYITKYQSLESMFDVAPHFSFGRISSRSIVYRSANCLVPEPLFSIGWVRSITQAGKVLVVSLHSQAEHLVYPNELECTGIKINGLDDDDEEEDHDESSKDPLIRHHGLYNLQISEQLFVQNLASIENCTRVPEHFSMLAKAPTSHRFYHSQFLPQLDGKWVKQVKRDQLNLTMRLPDLATLWFKGFKDRPDLYCVLMAGLQGTPYEGGLYTFDIQLGPKYPTEPPTFYCTTVLANDEVLIKTPNDKLDTLLSNGTTNQPFQPFRLLDSVVSLQAALFTDLTETGIFPDSGQRNHDMHVVVNTLDLMFRNVFDPPHLWVTECLQYFKMSYERLKKMLVKVVDGVKAPGVDYSVQPPSDGWIDAVVGRLRRFDVLLNEVMVNDDDDDDDV